MYIEKLKETLREKNWIDGCIEKINKNIVYKISPPAHIRIQIFSSLAALFSLFCNV